MIEELKKLIEELDKGDSKRESFDEIVLTEILWLAHSNTAFKEGEKEEIDSSSKFKEGEREEVFLPFLIFFQKWIQFIKKFLHEKKVQDLDDSNSVNQITTDKTIDLDNETSLSLKTSSSYQEKIRLPKKKEYFISNELIEALEPLKKSFISRQQSLVIDEIETVDYVARTNVINPIFPTKNENFYDLFLLIDISSSMSIWDESIQIFIEKLRVYDYFRMIKVLYVDSEDLEAPIYTTKKKTTKSTLYLNNHENRNLLFVLSDCIAPAWRKSRLLLTVFELNEKVPTVLINMLPRRMWHGTILSNTNFSKIHNPKKTLNLNFITSEIDDEYGEKLFKLPIVNLSKTDFELFANFIDGSNNNLCSALVATKAEIEYVEESSSRNITAAKRVEHFFQNASYEAHELALHLSITTHLNFDIMKIIQHNMLPYSQQIHLAEVFVGGLIDKHPDSKFYGFIKDKNDFSVRDILLDRLGDYKAMATLRKNSEFIAQNLGSSLDFMALLHGDFNSDEWSSEDETFAQIAGSLLAKMGGRYSKIASKIMVKNFDNDHNYNSELPKHVIHKIVLNNQKKDTIYPKYNTYRMGSNEYSDEQPIHNITFDYDFAIAKYLVTFEEYDLFCEAKNIYKPNDEGWGRGKRPVINVSWHDANDYCKWLSEQSGYTYRLPTESEWEYSCRSGTLSKWSFGDKVNDLDKYAWYYTANRGKSKTKEIGLKKPNNWGLYDMHGNVWEWCLDDYINTYRETPRDGSANKKGEKRYKVVRGGSCIVLGGDSRSAYRGSIIPSYRDKHIGFRILKKISRNRW